MLTNYQKQKYKRYARDRIGAPIASTIRPMRRSAQVGRIGR